jgi:hypothetical protein
LVAWAAIAEKEPDLAAATEAAFAARRLRVLATLRADGTPRLSDISGAFLRDGQLWLALIPSAKDRDLAADPRCSVHCAAPTDHGGTSVRISGRAERVPDSEIFRLGIRPAGTKPTFALYRVDVSEVVVTDPNAETRQIHLAWWNDVTGAGRHIRPAG